MRAQSHIYLGRFLAEHYLCCTPKHAVRAFLLGCIEPDRNPATYIKGSLRQQWLRGHNWGNANTYMRRLSARLEQKKQFGIWDYYTLGKLIHYTADAFTSPHNARFGTDLSQHRVYEAALQERFLRYLETAAPFRGDCFGSVFEAIDRFHREYLCKPIRLQTDCHYTLLVCCTVIAALLPANQKAVIAT